MLYISATVSVFAFKAGFARHASYVLTTSALNANDRDMRIFLAEDSAGEASFINARDADSVV